MAFDPIRPATRQVATTNGIVKDVIFALEWIRPIGTEPTPESIDNFGEFFLGEDPPFLEK